MVRNIISLKKMHTIGRIGEIYIPARTPDGRFARNITLISHDKSRVLRKRDTLYCESNFWFAIELCREITRNERGVSRALRSFLAPPQLQKSNFPIQFHFVRSATSIKARCRHSGPAPANNTRPQQSGRGNNALKR